MMHQRKIRLQSLTRLKTLPSPIIPASGNLLCSLFFFFQAEDGIRDRNVTGVRRVLFRSLLDHPALLCYALGNEIPSTIARWLGRRKIERYLERLYRVIKEEDPGGLVTYVNYPTTEYRSEERRVGKEGR